MKLIVTGGAGFIGSAFGRIAVRHSVSVVHLDKLTYAGNPENLTSVADSPFYKFAHGDICDAGFVHDLIRDEQPDGIIHFAAESHVDRSILNPGSFFETNLRGTFTLLEAARALKTPRFVHVSTDEVYGSLERRRMPTKSIRFRRTARTRHRKRVPICWPALTSRLTACPS